MIGVPLPAIVRELDGGNLTGERRYLLSDGTVVSREPARSWTITVDAPASKEREPNRHERRAKAKRERSGR